MSSKNRVAGGRIRGTGERHLVLVDVENIAGKPCPTDLDLDAVQAELLEVIPDLSEAQCIVVREQYRDAHVVQQHINAPENAQFNAELSSHIEGAVHLQFLTSLPE